MGYCKWDIMLHIVQCSDLGCRRTLGTECPSRAAARPNIGARGFGGLPEKILAETLFSFDFSCFYSSKGGFIRIGDNNTQIQQYRSTPNSLTPLASRHVKDREAECARTARQVNENP
jgi:hypothetical protein